MYVLASSTGSVDGNALPSNINITNLYRLSENENSANFIDLNNVTINNLVEPNELDPNSLLNKYNDMYQLEYNDKSEVLSEDESISPLISELVLKDPNGISPTLLGGVIDRSGLIPTITFNLSNTAFEGTNNSLYYEIDYNLLSTNAIVGSRGLNASDNYRLNADQYAALVYAYNNSENNIIENGALTNYQGESVGDWEPHFSIEVNGFTSGSRTFPMRIYSEAYLKDNSIYEQDKYFKDYHIIIQREPTIISTNATVTLDNVSRTETNIPVNYSFPTTGANSATMPPSGSIKSLFVGTNATINGLIKPGHEINFISLTHQVQGTTQIVLVDSSFYQVELIKKGSVSGNSNQFGFEITLSDELEAGVYIANYSYFESSNNRTIEFTKRESSDYNITNLDYEFYSKDDENTDFSFEQTNANFTTYIEFGYELASLTRGVPVNLTIELNEKANKDEFNYDYDITHYDLKLGDDVIISNLRISPFSTLNSAIISYDYEDGLRVYKVTYNITPESGVGVDIVHTIKERTISDIDFYVNDNLQALNEFSVTREDILSRIDVDFKFTNEELYNYVTMKVDDINHVDNDEIYLIDNEGIFSYGITYLQQPGLKTYEFILNREGDPNINYSLGTANITKSLGVSAYLIDVKYEGLDGGAIFKYPTIDVADSDGNIIDNDNPNYDTRFYAGGIDYLELQGVERYFRINSEVSDIDLEFYVPGFVLPYGATIKRFDKTINDWTTATTDVNDDSLKTDYIGFEDAVEVVRYRVIPEDGNEANFVDYYISAVDLNYNLTLRFNIYYNDPTHGIILANDINSPIKDNVLLISLKQMKIELAPTTSNSLLEVLPANDGLVNAFPSVLLKNDLRASFDGINNQSSLFYYLSAQQKTYRFGRNQTGAYNFTIKTPRYTVPFGETDNLNDSLTPNERYKYDIYTSARGATISEWYVENRKLPRMDDYIDGNAGLFYYVYFPSTNPINRELSIVINPETVDQKWGLYDDYGSFDQQTT